MSVSSLPLEKLRSIAGAPNVLTGVDCSPYVLEGRTPEAVVFPGSKEDVAAILGVAALAGTPVMVSGSGSKLGIGSPPDRLGLVLGLRRMCRIVEHEPGDLTATVEAGIALASLQEELGKRRQWLSLDPPWPERATIGGILASNASGPRRHLYGTARDLLIGLTVVMADGSLVRGGAGSELDEDRCARRREGAADRRSGQVSRAGADRDGWVGSGRRAVHHAGTAGGWKI